MPAKDYLIQFILSMSNGDPKDAVVNTFAVRDDAGTWDPLTSLLTVTGPIFGFYNFATSQGPVAKYLSLDVPRTGTPHTAKVFDVTGHLDGSPHGSPVAIDHGAITGTPSASAVRLPHEVAVALTLRTTGWRGAAVEAADNYLPTHPDADVAPDRPLQRHTGRIYVGPVSDFAVATGSYGAPVSSAFTTALTESAKHLQQQLQAVGMNWCVWSRKDQIFTVVTDVFVDDAADTQRRRGPKASGRTLVAVP